MSDLLTFTTADSKYSITVKGEFAIKCPEYATTPIAKLLTEKKIAQYFHNPKGPAIVRHSDNFSEYWLDGMVVTKEVAERIQHNAEFNDQLNDIVNE